MGLDVPGGDGGTDEVAPLPPPLEHAATSPINITETAIRVRWTTKKPPTETPSLDRNCLL